MRSKMMVWLTGLCVMLAAGSASAAMQKGSNLLAIQLREGNGDFAGAEVAGYLFPFRHSEMGVELQFWRFFSDDYAMALSGGIGFARETSNPGPNALPGDPAFRDFFSSWKLRAGGDRMARVNDRFHVYAGPGIQVWSGKITFKEDDTEIGESSSVMRIGVDGRMGAVMHWSESFGMTGYAGHYWAYASVKQDGAEAKWTPSGAEGGMGFFFGF